MLHTPPSLFSLAKQKLEDRLAAAAREKLAQASKESKEKQLQAERKRKAALFLQTLKNPLPEADVGKLEESTFGVEVCRRPSRWHAWICGRQKLVWTLWSHSLSQMPAAQHLPPAVTDFARSSESVPVTL